MRVLLTIAYDGSNYCGYQKQPKKKTIQSALEEVLKVINKAPTPVSGSGRTDSGVHALGQKVHFDLLPSMNEIQVKDAMNSLLPEDIYVKEVKFVGSNFHARFDVKEKTYLYKINLGEYDPIAKDYIYQYGKKLNINSIKRAAKYLTGTHNFKAFTKVEEEKDFERTIYEITIKKKGNLLEFEFTGNGFLRYMVRNMVGTLIEVGEGKRKPSSIQDILESNDRKKAGKKAPACGLYLKEVVYELEKPHKNRYNEK